jgi:hypothetical protein
MYLAPQLGTPYGGRGNYLRPPGMRSPASANRRRRRSLGWLGAAAVAPSNPYIAQVCPGGAAASPCGCTVDTANVNTLFEQSTSSLYLMWPPPDPAWANCSGISSPTGAQEAGAAITASAKLVTAINPIAGAVDALVGVVTGLFGAHHAAAVKAQNNALCISVPEFNSVLQQIDSGQVAASAAGYQQLATSFQSDMQAGTSYKKCDALYAYNLAAQMVIAARMANLNAGVGGGTGLTTSVAGIPLWALLAAGAAAVFLL